MKHLKLILSILFIFCLTRTYADDSNYLFRHYQVENGLSDNMATCCVQDRKGYIWIGTRDGLNRFDGYTFKVFRNDPDETETLGSNWITCLGCDMNGDLWVGTLSGLYQYDDEKESFRHIPFTADKGIDIFQFDKDNKLWILMDGNLIRFNTEDSQVPYLRSGRQPKLHLFLHYPRKQYLDREFGRVDFIAESGRRDDGVL